MQSKGLSRVFSNTIVQKHQLFGTFRYDLNQISYDYTVKVTKRFQGLDLIECLKNYGWRFVTLYRRQ